VDDHHGTQTFYDRIPEKGLQGIGRLLGAQTMQIDMRLNRKTPLVQASDDFFADSRGNGFHVFGRVGDPITVSGTDQPLQSLSYIVLVIATPAGAFRCLSRPMPVSIGFEWLYFGHGLSEKTRFLKRRDGLVGVAGSVRWTLFCQSHTVLFKQSVKIAKRPVRSVR
jgi:hypothetical protein